MKILRTLGAPALLSILLASCAPVPSSPTAPPAAAPESGAPAAGENAPTAVPAPETATGTSTETVTETVTMTTTEAAPGASSEATPAPTPQAATNAPVPLAEPVTTTIPLTTSPERSIVPPAGGEHTNGTHAPAAGGHETTDQGDQNGQSDHSGHSMANPAGPFDAAFIDDMILHHEGAIAMAQELLQNSERPEFVEMGNAILAAQGAEIEMMRGWRAEWYPDLPAGQTTGMTMGQMAVDGDDSVSYEERFIVAMIDHHAGAIAMAQRALEEAEHAELRDLAAQIIAAQEAEIAQMQTWLEELQLP